MRIWAPTLTAALLAPIALSVSCGGSEPPPQAPAHRAPVQSPGQYPPPRPPISQGPGPMSPFGTILSDPRSIHQILSGALSGSSAAFGSLVGGEAKVIQQGILIKAQTDATEMVPATAMMTARLSAGRHAHAKLILEPGVCYTTVGFSAPGVFDYQLHMIASPPLPPQVLAQSVAGRPDPTLGAGGNCIRNPYTTPIEVTIDMHVRSGQGLVGAQTFQR